MVDILHGWQTPTTQGSDEIEATFEEMIHIYTLCVQLGVNYISPIWTDTRQYGKLYIYIQLYMYNTWPINEELEFESDYLALPHFVSIV